MGFRAWIIHKLGGYTRQECSDMMRVKNGQHIASPAMIHPRGLKAAYSYYVEPDTPEVRHAQEQMAANELAKKIAFEMLDHGLIRLTKQVDAVQDRAPIKRYRLSAAAWVLDATQMPFYGSDEL